MLGGEAAAWPIEKGFSEGVPVQPGGGRVVPAEAWRPGTHGTQEEPSRRGRRRGRSPGDIEWCTAGDGWQPQVSQDPFLSECSSFSPPTTVILLILLCFEGLLFLIFTSVMFGTQVHSICTDETVSGRPAPHLRSRAWGRTQGSAAGRAACRPDLGAQ